MERRQAGFSLIELMIALVVTMIVTGSVYQLLTAGQTAFRREPEMADRQQNVRMAMDLIADDVYKAGNGLPPFVPVFRPGLDGVGDLGSGGTDTDEIEVVYSSGCGALGVCKQSGGNVFTHATLHSCMTFPRPVMLICQDPSERGCPPEGYAIYWLEEPAGPNSSGTGNCESGNDDGKGGHGNVPSGQGEPPIENPNGNIPFQVQYLSAADVVRYRIQRDAEGVPSLQRSTLGGAADLDGGSSWVTVARGIEDLQVQYLWTASGTPTMYADQPPAMPGDLAGLVRRVRLTLSARSVDSARVAGVTKAAAGSDAPDAIRGQLVSEITPRAAQTKISMDGGQM